MNEILVRPNCFCDGTGGDNLAPRSSWHSATSPSVLGRKAELKLGQNDIVRRMHCN